MSSEIPRHTHHTQPCSLSLGWKLPGRGAWGYGKCRYTYPVSSLSFIFLIYEWIPTTRLKADVRSYGVVPRVPKLFFFPFAPDVSGGGSWSSSASYVRTMGPSPPPWCLSSLFRQISIRFRPPHHKAPEPRAVYVDQSHFLFTFCCCLFTQSSFERSVSRVLNWGIPFGVNGP